MDGKKILKIVAWIVVPTVIMGGAWIGWKLYKKEPIFGKKGDNDPNDPNVTNVTRDADGNIINLNTKAGEGKDVGGGRRTDNPGVVAGRGKENYVAPIKLDATRASSGISVNPNIFKK